MSFAAEMKDFLAGMKTVSGTMNDSYGSETQRQASDAMIEYRNAQTDLARQKLDQDDRHHRDRLAMQSRALGGRGSSRGSRRGAVDDFDFEAAKREDGTDKPAPSAPAGKPSALPIESAGHGASWPEGAAPNVAPAPAATGSDVTAGAADAAYAAAKPSASVAGALPVDDTARPTAAPTGASADYPAGNSEGANSGGSSVGDALHNAMLFMNSHYGLSGKGAVSTPEAAASAEDGKRRFASGEGAFTPEEVEAAKKAVDPDGKLDESQRTLRAFMKGYEFHLAKGGEKGQKAAASYATGFLQYARVKSAMYADEALKALNNGDQDRANKLAVAAYGVIPDGKDLKVTERDGKPYYEIIDNGKVTASGAFTPQQFAAVAMRLRSGEEFWDTIISAAGSRGAKAAGGTSGGAVGGTTGGKAGGQKKAPAAEKTPYNTESYEDRAETVRKAMGDEYGDEEDKASVAYMIKEKGSPRLRGDLERITDRVINFNNFRGDPRVAADLVARLSLQVDPANPDALPPGVQVDPKSGSIMFRGEEFKVDAQTMSTISGMRSSALSYATKAQQKAQEDAERKAQQPKSEAILPKVAKPFMPAPGSREELDFPMLP